jgi:hypothetical protein
LSGHGIYLRVCTDGQKTENQRRELEAVAARSGWRSSGSMRALTHIPFFAYAIKHQTVLADAPRRYVLQESFARKQEVALRVVGDVRRRSPA